MMLSVKNFADLGVSPKLLPALADLGHNTPFPVQIQSIPVLLNHQDLLAQAQTGTGKTAAFALPILSNFVPKQNYPQALILVPTRELAIQVADSFRAYAKYLPEFVVATIYGGQDFGVQLKTLKRGAHVIVGTPGRVIDHLNRRTLQLDKVRTVVLDEADEMLKMGFLEDVNWILEKVPRKRQTALFSATIPTSIQKIARDHLKNPKEVRINPENKTVAAIKQHYLLVSNSNKAEAISRFLAGEDFDAVLIFTRTKHTSTELAKQLAQAGHRAAALNGDLRQSMRERVISQVKKKEIDIIVATDVAARGLDLDRLSHVISYDPPHNTETYVHRIGRTGRAGREGRALIFISPHEQRVLKEIERAVNQQITAIKLPSAHELNIKRSEESIAKIKQVLEKSKLDYCRKMAEEIIEQCACSPLDLAAALIRLSQNEQPFKELEEAVTFVGGEHKRKKKRNRSRNHSRR
jgi:ATP-dependent RNA helicase DeaD